MTQAASQTVARATLEEVLRGIRDVSTLPHIAARVMEVAQDPNSCASDLKEIVEGDVAMSARVLRCVNSSAYALRTKITSLQQAVAYLGLKQIRNLAVTASVSELFRREDALGSYRRSELWRHMVSVGICARLIALRLKLRNFEDLFLAGLMHDVGIILEDQQLHDSFRAVVDSLEETRTLAEVERDRLGFDHAMLGEQVAALWRFPDGVKAAIRHHHASVHYRGEDADLVRCVEVANIICTYKGITSMGVNLVRISPPVIIELGLTKEDVLVLSEDLDHEIALHQSLFQM